MKKNQIRKKAQNGLEEGLSKQEVYNALYREAKKTPEDLAQIIKPLPTTDFKKQYKVWHSIFIGLMVLIILLKMLATLPAIIEDGLLGVLFVFLVPLLNIILLIGVVNYRSEYFRWTGILSVIGLIRFVGSGEEISMDIFFMVDLLLIGMIIFLSFFLLHKMTTPYRIVSEKYTNKEGQQRIRKKAVFQN